MWTRLGYHVVWVAVFRGNVLPVSSAGCLKAEVLGCFRTVCVLTHLMSVQRETIVMLLGLTMRSSNWGGGVWYGIIVLGVWYPIPHSTDVRFFIVVLNTVYILYIVLFLATLASMGISKLLRIFKIFRKFRIFNVHLHFMSPRVWDFIPFATLFYTYCLLLKLCVCYRNYSILYCLYSGLVA